MLDVVLDLEGPTNDIDKSKNTYTFAAGKYNLDLQPFYAQVELELHLECLSYAPFSVSFVLQTLLENTGIKYWTIAVPEENSVSL